MEVVLRDSLHLLQGKRIGLITNHTGRDRSGTSTIDLLHRAPGVRLTALFAPEHGIRGAAQDGAKIASSVDSATGIPIYSLYGETRVPTPEMLREVDVLLYDIQDVGARVYTYVWTMALAAEAAGKLGKKFIVLDRPNPIRGDRIEGGVLKPEFRSFVGQYPVALRYGLTAGELLRYLVGTGQVAADVTVIPMRGWRQSMWWDETAVPWVNPSPNMRSVEAALLYPGTVFFEATNVSEGRGTDRPFHLIGASWLTDAGAVARDLNAKQLPGVRFDSTSRTIARGAKFAGQTIPMIEITVTDRNAVRPVELGAHMLRAIYRRHPREFTWREHGIERLSGSRALREAVEREGGIETLFPIWRRESEQFAAEAERYRLYAR
ncbi:MAG: exo-beta-N-acetylmuramidase NamZ domain-containing protein [Gemmatimonadaceae bacterium]